MRRSWNSRVGAAARRAQRGVTIVVVLLLLSVMVLGGLAMARMTESSVLVIGNVATKDASVHASEIGWNLAYTAAVGLANESADSGGWYWATMQPVDAQGIPAIDWNATPTSIVGRFTVTYAVERMCTVAAVTSAARECLIKREKLNTPEDKGHDAPGYEPPSARQFRITVRVTETAAARGTQTWVQALVTRGG